MPRRADVVHDPRDLVGLARDEIWQLSTSGYDVTGIAAPVDLRDDPRLWEAALDAARHVPRLADWPYHEPSTAAAIVAALGPDAESQAAPSDVADRIHGAWLGRCAGCILGKPVEGWPADRIHSFLKAVDAWPPRGYLPALDPSWTTYPAMKPSWRTATAGNIAGVPRDDDLDYTILGLHVLETYGFDPTPDVLAAELLDRFAFTQVFTAERVVYRNLVCGIPPAQAAAFRNPYREWIGAMIRADIYGMTAPAMPRVAAYSAMHDALFTHRENGVYAAMWAAATLAAAIGGATSRDAVEAGLAQIPPQSRSAEAVRDVLRDANAELGWEARIGALRGRFDAYGWVHALPNLAAAAAAVLHGTGDLGRTIGFAVAAGWDTDSAAATAGAIAGALSGSSRLDPRWIAPLEDRIASAVRGHPEVRIADAAARTARLAVARLREAGMQTGPTSAASVRSTTRPPAKAR